MKFRCLFMLLPVMLFCCKKKDNNTSVINPANQPFSYSLKYDSVVSIAAGSTFNFSFNVKVLTGKITDNRLTCSLEGLPASVTVAPSSILVAQLLGGVFTINVGVLDLGYYPFLLKVKSEKYGTQVYNLSLHVIPAPDFAPLLAGNYASSYDYCGGADFIYYAAQAATVADTPYLLKMTNLKDLGSSVVVRAWVSKTITIPVQTIAGKTIWGSGTYTHDARPAHEEEYIMTVKDTIVSGIDTQICTMHLVH